MTDAEKLGKYELRGVLGKGAMGIVYKAYDPFIERTVAIKTIRKDLVDPDLAEASMARFKNEARAAGRLLHPNIVSVYEYGEEATTAYIVMEYVEGTGLRDYLGRKATFDLGHIVVIVSQALTALDFAHQRGVVHRDIKPANLILTPAGVLKVADFGIARIDTTNLTCVGSVMGTPSYMSPEQCKGTALDGRSDLFSTGVVLYELLTGERPFGGTVEAIAYKILHETPRAPASIARIPIPDALDAVVMKAIAKSPEARFQSAREFAHALRVASGTNPELDVDATLLDLAAVKMLPRAHAEWDDGLLGTAEQQLARHIGPMARVIVRKAAAQTGDVMELVALLADHIPDLAERKLFTQRMRGTVATNPHARSAHSAAGAVAERSASGAASGSAGGTADRSPLDPAFLERATARLTVRLGPIARVIVKRASHGATTKRQFIASVCEHLDEEDRDAFLQEIGASPS